MKEETHIVIIEVLATTVENLSRKSNKYENENFKQSSQIMDMKNSMSDTVVLIEQLSKDSCDKDAEIARLNEENLGLELILTAIQENIKPMSVDNFDTLCHEEMVEALVKRVKEREAEANSYRELYGELKEAVTGMRTSSPKDALDTVVWTKDTLNKIEESCDSRDVSHMSTLASVSNKVEHLAQLYVLALKHRDRSDHFEAKASKLNAEKRKLMELLKAEVKGGYIGTVRVLDKYKAWQREQAAKRKGKVTG